ncbi:MAG: hypothetical protein WKG32_13135, partial [Gemmatimonadaceae bacterium]
CTAPTGEPASRALPPAAAGTSAPTRSRPTLRRIHDILTGYRRDRASIVRAFADEHVNLRLRKICYVSPRNVVACMDTREIIDVELAHAADRNVMQMTLNDLMDVLDAAPGADVLAACGSASGAGLTHLLPLVADVGPSPARAAGPLGPGGRGGRDGPGGPRGGGQGAQPWLLPGSQAQPVMSACRAAQRNSVQDGLGAFTPSDPGYDQAVSTAVAAMDAVVQQCVDEDKSMVTNPGSGGSQAPPTTNNTTGISGGTGDGSRPGAGDSGDKKDPKPSAGEAFLSVLNIVLGAAETVITAVGPLVGAVENPTPAGLAATVIGAVGTVAGGTELVTGNETAGTLSNGAQVTSTLITVVEGAASGSINVAVTTSPELLALAGDAGLAIGAEAAFCPVVAAGFSGYAAERLANQALGGALDRAAVGVTGTISDFVFDNFTRKNTGGAGGAQRPRPEGGTPTCADVAAAWQRFKTYCSQAGNGWRTYDCMLFVARMNGCADPGLINPSPEGEYTCAPRCSNLGRASSGAPSSRRNASVMRQGSAGGIAGAGSCGKEQTILQCEIRKRQRDMISTPSPSGSSGPSCREQAEGMASMEALLREHIKSEWCKRASSDPASGDRNGVCAAPGAMRPDTDGKVRRP